MRLEKYLHFMLIIHQVEFRRRANSRRRPHVVARTSSPDLTCRVDIRRLSHTLRAPKAAAPAYFEPLTATPFANEMTYTALSFARYSVDGR